MHVLIIDKKEVCSEYLRNLKWSSELVLERCCTNKNHLQMPCVQASFPGLLCFIFTIHESERAVKTIANVNWRTNQDTLNEGNISIPFYRVMPCSSITATNSIDRSSQRLNPRKLSADVHRCYGWPGFGGRVVTLGCVQVWTIRSTHCIDHTLRCEPRGGEGKKMKGEERKGEIKLWATGSLASSPSHAHAPSPNLLLVISGMGVHLLVPMSNCSPLLRGETPSNPPIA